MIIKSIKDGHSFVSYIFDGPTIEFGIEKAIMGDCIELEEDEDGLVKVSNAAFNGEIRLITDKGIEKTCKILKESSKTL